MFSDTTACDFPRFNGISLVLSSTRRSPTAEKVAAIPGQRRPPAETRRESAPDDHAQQLHNLGSVLLTTLKPITPQIGKQPYLSKVFVPTHGHRITSLRENAETSAGHARPEPGLDTPRCLRR
jgi:hypothetical protein